MGESYILMVHGPASAETTLGLADHCLRRSQNAKLGFVDGKVKTRINRTLAWLSNKTKQELTVVQSSGYDFGMT